VALAADRVSRFRPILCGLIVAAMGGALVGHALARGPFASDFDQLWVAGRALLHGSDPYGAVAQARINLGYPLYYPLPAVVLTLPLALLPLHAARLAFGIICGFIAGYGLQRCGLYALLVVASPLFQTPIIQGQIAPAITGAAMVPTLGFLLVAKPTIGLPLWISRPSRRAAIGAIALVVLTVVVWPWWPKAWLAAIQVAPHIRPPLMRPGGILLLLGALRWRRPEGRLLAAWAFMPHTEALYDLMPLFLVAASVPDALALVVCSWVALLGHAMIAQTGGADLSVRIAAQWPMTLALVYIPALILVLARPNTAPQEAAAPSADPVPLGTAPRSLDQIRWQ
jgi:hypothetical protein